jgi:hypothetical protein
MDDSDDLSQLDDPEFLAERARVRETEPEALGDDVLESCLYIPGRSSGGTSAGPAKDVRRRPRDRAGPGRRTG